MIRIEIPLQLQSGQTLLDNQSFNIAFSNALLQLVSKRGLSQEYVYCNIGVPYIILQGTSVSTEEFFLTLWYD